MSSKSDESMLNVPISMSKLGVSSRPIGCVILSALNVPIYENILYVPIFLRTLGGPGVQPHQGHRAYRVCSGATGCGRAYAISSSI